MKENFFRLCKVRETDTKRLQSSFRMTKHLKSWCKTLIRGYAWEQGLREDQMKAKALLGKRIIT